MAERMMLSPGVADDAVLDVDYHPDVVGGPPGTGAVKQVRISDEEWFELPQLRLGVLVDHAPNGDLRLLPYMPSVHDTLYGGIYGPYWFFSAIRMITAAYTMGCLDEERLPGALRFLADNDDTQSAISAAARLGVPPLELFMILQERL